MQVKEISIPTSEETTGMALDQDSYNPLYRLACTLLDVMNIFELQIQPEIKNASTKNPIPDDNPPPLPGERKNNWTDAWTRLISMLQGFIANSVIPPDLANTLLDYELLSAAKRITEPQFSKKGVRLNTMRLYKQKKFNLLREENEGFAKLATDITELLQSETGDDDDDATTDERAKRGIHIITSLIGYFDLDPNRCLDVLLDIFAANVVEHCTLIIRLLKYSSWWPNITTHKRQPFDQTCKFQSTIVENLKHKEGSAVAAQLLGFKFRSCARLGEAPAETLVYLVGVLIKEGFITLPALYPHLGPDNKDVQQECVAWEAEMDLKAFKAKSSALAMAAPLADESSTNSVAPTTGDAAVPVETVKPPLVVHNQKVPLLRALLAVGDVASATYILAQFPKICGPYSDLADLLHIIVHRSISNIYQDLRPLYKYHSSILTPKFKPTNPRDRDSELVIPSSPTPIRTLNKLQSSTGKQTYRFFYDDWKKDIPVHKTVFDFYAVSLPFLRFSGVRIGRDPVLVCKLCRLGKITTLMVWLRICLC